MKIAAQTVVSIHYTLRDKDGKVLDSTDGREPLSYLHGADEILPGLERALEGHMTGDVLDVQLTPKDGYGERDPEGQFEVEREAFPADLELQPGDELVGQLEGGEPMPVRIVTVGMERVTVDTNHPLAGETLHFEVEIRGVRGATAEELESGHAPRFTLAELPQID
jgi:FKBP-type peptidyl-prolyl cis-trans isomerase SlyD